MKRNNESFTLEENLVLTNDELLSNWTKFASLVKTYEDIPYDTAKKKALAMLDDETALSYLENVRKYPNGKPEIKAEVPEPQPSVTAKPKLPPEVTIYHKNYDRLIALAPGLEEKLSKVGRKGMDGVYGKSKKTGYMDFNLELIHVDKDSFYLALSHYFKQNGDMVADPDMVVRLDLQNRLIEALSFQNAFYYKEVYDDNFDRKMVDQSEKKSQNAFLTQWLKNLKTQGHKIVWKEPESTGIADSTLTIEYEKPREPEKVVEINEPEGEENQPVKYSDEKIEKLVSAIMYNEHFYNIKFTDAKKKAQNMMKNGEAPDYLLDVIDNMQSNFTVNFMSSNYFKLLYLVPDLLERLTEDTISVVLSSNEKVPLKGKSKSYEIVNSRSEVDSNRAFVIQQYKGGSLAIEIQTLSRYVSVEIISGGFGNEKDYYDQTATQEQQYKANEMFDMWLNYLIDREYHATWKGEIIPEPILPVIDLEIPTLLEEPSGELANETESVEESKETDEIPDFEIGKVQLVEAHIKRGITQKDIDWINQHQQGMTITPRRKPMINNTKSREMDKAMHAMKPGFRISATGKLYYEGRSNRSDKRNTGL